MSSQDEFSTEQYAKISQLKRNLKLHCNQMMMKLVTDENFCDVTFVVGEGDDKKEFGGHKAIFAAQSVVFNKMFEHQMKETMLNRVEITDIKPEIFEEFKKFIYTGVVDFRKFAEELIIVAEKVF